MAIYHTRSSKKTAPLTLTLTPRFVVLVALFAVVGFQASPSSSTSIFALAAEAKYEGSTRTHTRGSSNSMLLQRTPGEEDIGEEVEYEIVEEEEEEELQYEGSTRGFTNRMLLQRTQAEEEDADDGMEHEIVAKAAATCTDKQTIKIKPRKRKRMLVCDYVKEDPKARCKKNIKRVVKRKGKVVRITKIKPKKHCCATCNTAATLKPTSPPTVAAQSSCPDIVDIDEIHGQLCFTDREELGFEINQECNYNWVGTGCTEKDYQCQAMRTCRCETDGDWNCWPNSLEGVNLAILCPREPQPYEKSGVPCTPDDSEQSLPITVPAQSSCPDIVDDLHGQLCITDREELGFGINQECDYNWVGTGCTEKDYQCLAMRTCRCEKPDGETSGYWGCWHRDFEGVNLAYNCPREPQPYEKSGVPCTPDDSGPVGIRR